MALDIHNECDNGGCRMRLRGRLHVDELGLFHSRCDELLQRPDDHPIHVDLGGLDCIDSMGLGMLLHFRERARLSGRDLLLANCHDALRDVISEKNFGALFLFE